MNKFPLTHPVWIISIYLISAVSLVIAILCDNLPYLLLLPVVVYLAYDVNFYSSDDSLKGRSINSTNDSIKSACTYLSYFIALSGIVLAMDAKNQTLITGILGDDSMTSNWIVAYFFTAIILALTALLFIPVQYSKDDDENNGEVSKALKACFSIVMFLEKVSILFFVYVLLSVLKYVFLA